MTGWTTYGNGIRTRAVDEFIVWAQTLRMRQDTDSNVIYFDETLSLIENYTRFLCRDEDMNPKELTLEQRAQLERLRTGMIHLLGG
ncbi:hypothetical protein HYT57_03535 [Candidatus Woesearchaeota archaeon]|nr:hypothetical protein [Candidatus Woesearchaeota archaeon]